MAQAKAQLCDVTKYYCDWNHRAMVIMWATDLNSSIEQIMGQPPSHVLGHGQKSEK